MDARVTLPESGLLPPRVRRLLGGRCGIVTGLLQYLPDRTDPAVFYSTGIETDVGRLAGTDAAGLEAGGTGLECATSLLCTLGEAAERYCLYFPDRDVIVEGSHAEVGARHATVDFEYIDVYDPERRARMGLNPLTPETPIHWQPTRNLLTGETVFVPAEWIWLGAIDPATERSLPTTSSGCACGPSRAMAALGALEEYIERDAIMRTWYQLRAPRPTALPPDAETASIVDDRLDADRLDCRFFEIDGPTGFPTVGCAMVETRERAPKFAVGGAHALDRHDAYLGAFLEVAQTWVYLKDLVLREPEADIDPEHIYNLEDNLRYYAQPDRFDAVEFLIERDPPTAPPALGRRPGMTPAAALHAHLDRFAAEGFTPLAVDVTTRDVRSVGFSVVRVVVPELVGLSLPSLPPVRHPDFAEEPLTGRPHPYP